MNRIEDNNQLVTVSLRCVLDPHILLDHGRQRLLEAISPQAHSRYKTIAVAQVWSSTILRKAARSSGCGHAMMKMNRT